MKRKILVFAVVAVCTVLFVSCKKDDSVVSTNEFKITSISPAKGALNVKPDAKIVVVFNKKPALLTAYGTGVEFFSNSGIATVIVTYDNAFTVTYTPKERLSNSTEYKFSLKGATALDGTVLPDLMSTFTVEK